MYRKDSSSDFALLETCDDSEFDIKPGAECNASAIKDIQLGRSICNAGVPASNSIDDVLICSSKLQVCA